MSRNIQLSKKNIKALTEVDYDEQFTESDSDLNQWSSKKKIKKEVIDGRKQKDQLIKVDRLTD